MSEFQKILSQLLKGKKLKQPYSAKTPSSTYRESLAENLEEYNRRLINLKTDGPLTSWVKSQITALENIKLKLLSSIDQYLSGSAGKAYDDIEALMQFDHIKRSFIELKKPLDIYLNSTQFNKSLFRVRESENHINSRKDIFHIPFESRNLVRTQRYSIAGVPCLYLGSSLYVCWQEMGKPSLSKLHLSHFKVNENKKIYVLNFAFSLETLKHRNLELFFDNDIGLDEAKAYITILPIIMACSYNAERPGSSFCIEYVIPNLILQWISKEKRPVSGIMYLSTKTKQLRNSDIGINFVFPPRSRTVKNRGYCPKLSEIFVLSKPVSWQLLNTIETNENMNGSNTMSMTDDIENELIKNYQATKFYNMEAKLKKLTKLEKLPSN